MKIFSFDIGSGHFYLPKWGGPASENTICTTNNLALSDRTALKKIQDDVFEQLVGKQWQLLSI